MSNQPANFGSQQFQKIQFGHNPNAIPKGEEAEREIAKKIAKPAKIMKLLGILSLLVNLIATGIGAVSLAVNKDSYIRTMNDQARAAIIAEAKRPTSKLNKEQQEEYSRRAKGNQNLMTILMGATVCSGFFAAALSVFYIVAGHRMAQLTGYGQGLFASIMAIVPGCSIVGILGIPIGVWCLLTLQDKDVKRAFKN